MKIDLKEIVKPKFAKGQEVYALKSDGSVKKATIRYWEVVVNSEKPVQVTYFIGDATWWPEQSIFTTAEEAFRADK